MVPSRGRWQLLSSVPLFEVVGQPCIADARSLGMTGWGALTSRMDHQQYLCVEIRNMSAEAFGYDTVLDVSNRGRATLADCGVRVQDRWTATALRATRQEVYEGAVSVPPLRSGGCVTIYFQVNASHARQATPMVEFVLHNTWETADHAVFMRYSSSPVLVGGVRGTSNDPELTGATTEALRVIPAQPAVISPAEREPSRLTAHTRSARDLSRTSPWPPTHASSPQNESSQLTAGTRSTQDMSRTAAWAPTHASPPQNEPSQLASYIQSALEPSSQQPTQSVAPPADRTRVSRSQNARQ